MATGTQVPWTDPGGTPCCCAAECYTSFATDPGGNTLAQGQWQQISEIDYVTLLAGGSYSGTVVANITGTNQLNSPSGPVTRVETQTANETQLMSVVRSAEGGCFVQVESLENMTVAASRDGGFSTTYSDYKFRAIRTLGTQSGLRYLNLSSVRSDGVWDPQMVFIRAFLVGSFSGQYSFLGNVADLPLFSNSQLTTAVATIAIVVNGNTYSQSGIFVQVNSFGQQDNIMSGGATLTVALTPSAP